jgi:hypothetical protein
MLMDEDKIMVWFCVLAAFLLLPLAIWLIGSIVMASF